MNELPRIVKQEPLLAMQGTGLDDLAQAIITGISVGSGEIAFHRANSPLSDDETRAALLATLSMTDEQIRTELDLNKSQLARLLRRSRKNLGGLATRVAFARAFFELGVYELIEAAADLSLSVPEQQIVDALSVGKTLPEAASLLDMSPREAESRVTHIGRKTGWHSHEQIVLAGLTSQAIDYDRESAQVRIALLAQSIPEEFNPTAQIGLEMAAKERRYMRIKPLIAIEGTDLHDLREANITGLIVGSGRVDVDLSRSPLDDLYTRAGLLAAAGVRNARGARLLTMSHTSFKERVGIIMGSLGVSRRAGIARGLLSTGVFSIKTANAPTGLSKAEKIIVDDISRGKTTTQIAADPQRRTLNTIRNQLTKVRTRTEYGSNAVVALAALVSGEVGDFALRSVDHPSISG